MGTNEDSKVKVSVIIPVYNGGEFLEECLDSILKQEIPSEDSLRHPPFHIELSIYDDASTDQSPNIIQNWKIRIDDGLVEGAAGFEFSIKTGQNSSGVPQGAGFAKNRAIEQSNGDFICFCDADDIMMRHRIFKQYSEAIKDVNSLVGCRFIRLPEDSTRTLTKWQNGLSQKQLYTQIYQSFGPGLLMPTWFCHRSVFNRIPGGLAELGLGMPEDIIFYYKHLDRAGTLSRVDEPLIVYRYHRHSTTFTISQETIWNLRLERLQAKVLAGWANFTIWNAGRMGRRFYRSLNFENRKKVASFCDVDAQKISQGFYHPYPLKERVPIVHFREARPPFVICVKTELTLDEDGPFMTNLKSLDLEEGLDYIFFN